MGIFTGKNRITRSRRIGSALLAVILIVQLVTVGVSARDLTTGTYALRVTTGESAGDDVVFFGLKYRDYDGYIHVEYVFPHEGALQDTCQEAYAAGFDVEMLETFQKLGINIADLAKQKPLQPYTTNTFFFRPTFDVKDVLGVEAYCFGDSGMDNQIRAWSLQDIRLYEVTSVDGLDVVGSVSDQFSVRFTGNELLSLARSTNLSWTDNELYEFSVLPTADVQMLPGSGVYARNDESAHHRMIRVDFADVYDGGIEVLNQKYGTAKTVLEAGFKEALVMEIQYIDVYGCVIRTAVPVVTSALGYALQNGENLEEQVIAGFAQQGETIAMRCCLPDLMEVRKVTFYNGEKARERTRLQVVDEAEIRFTGVSVYPDNSVKIAINSEPDAADAPQYLFTSVPSTYYAATFATGEVLNENDDHEMAMRPYKNGVLLKPEISSERYLVELKADEIGLYNTPEDIYLTIKYQTVKGEHKQSEPISVKEASRDFYGYWPASGEDYPYQVLMYQDGEEGEFGGVKLVLELWDVEFFSGITLNTGNTSRDWQMEGIQVSRLDDVGPRTCTWKSGGRGGYTTDREYTRETYGDVIFTMNEKVLVQPGESEEMDFVSNNVVEEEDRNWSDIRYSMTYEESCSNLGFTKARENYTVEVQVSGDTVSLEGNGDTGSRNQFYFQLEFENGSSGYVLANQQLGADGFRSGYLETFNITTNQDYGELVAVRIIPDDTSEDSDIYDKLNIEEICVRRNSNESLSRQWRITEVGWIGIDFRDEGAGVSIGGQKGRTEAEIARSYPVTYRSYGVNLLFNINTGTYASEAANANTSQFYGTINGVLWYTSSTGEVKPYSFDLIQEIYKYANKTPNYGKDALGQPTSAVSDRNYMFRANHTDRFILSVDDVAKLNRLELNVTSFTGGQWRINNVAIQQILSEGVLQISENDEYVRTNQTKELCANVYNEGEEFTTLDLPTGIEQSVDIYFPDNTIEVDEENFTWVSSVSREPASENDEVNIYIYPSVKNSNLHGEDGDPTYKLDASVLYTNAFGTRWRSGAENLTYNVIDGQPVFSVQGLGASGMSTLNKLYIEVDTGRSVQDVYIDHAIVQQVRAGVVINSYYLYCANMNGVNGISVEPGAITGAQPEQVVTLALGNDTLAANLIAEDRDIAVALRYTTTNESGGREYQSKNVFLTDFQVKKLKAGDLLTLVFNEQYVREITGIVLVATGGIVAEVDKACVGEYALTLNDDQEVTERTQIGWYSFDNGVQMDNSSATMLPTPDSTVYPLQMQFITAEAGATMESGTNTPVAMRLGYKTGQGNTEELYIPDLREYVTSGENPFATGSVTNVKLLLSDAKELRWMELNPYDEDPEVQANLKLKSVAAILGEGTNQQRVNRTLPEDTIFSEDAEEPYRVNMANIVVELQARGTNPNTGSYDMQAHNVSSVGKEAKLQTMSGGEVSLEDIVVNNSGTGFVITAEQVAADGGTSSMNHLLDYVSDDEVLFLTPINETGAYEKYRISVASEEVPDVKAVVIVEVKPEPVEEEEEEFFREDFEEDESEADSGSGDAGGSSSGGTDTGGESSGGSSAGGGSSGSADAGGSSSGGDTSETT